MATRSAAARETSAGDALRSPAGKKSNAKAPPARQSGKKRPAASAASNNTNGGGLRQRATRRELKKLTEMDLEEKDELPAGSVGSETPSKPPTHFGDSAQASRASITPTSLHDDFVNLMKAQGLEKLATDAGLMKDGALVELQQTPTSTPTARSTAPGSASRARSSAATASTPASADADSPSFASPSSGKKRKYVKINKGLRHFSMKVCQKVEEKHVTSYNEVADELVREFVTMRPNDSAYDEKNIRRRVYDALNVLMAMDIISKERKEIRWKGLPNNVQQHDTEMLLAERNERMKRIEQKKQHLQDLLVQQVAMKNLLKRNAARRKAETETPLASVPRDEGRIFLPFIAVNTSKDTVIQCEMSEDRQDIFFNFSAPFEIHDDTDILRKLNLHKAPFSELKGSVPEKLLSYLPAECEAKSDGE